VGASLSKNASLALRCPTRQRNSITCLSSTTQYRVPVPQISCYIFLHFNDRTLSQNAS
jgi:hypothetical protein